MENSGVQTKAVNEKTAAKVKGRKQTPSVDDSSRSIDARSPSGPPFDIFDETSWCQVPDEELRSRFAQFRDLARNRILALQEQLANFEKMGREDNNLRSEYENASKEAAKHKTLIAEITAKFVDQGEEILHLQQETEAEANAVMADLKEAVSSIVSQFFKFKFF